MKLPIMSRKDSYIYKISKEIHTCTKITSYPLEKLTDHCIEHKINMRNDKGCDPSMVFFTFFSSSSIFFTILCMAFYRKRAKRCTPIRQAS